MVAGASYGGVYFARKYLPRGYGGLKKSDIAERTNLSTFTHGGATGMAAFTGLYAAHLALSVPQMFGAR
jgi:hypothetical protein